MDGILLRPLGYGDEGRLVAIHEVVPKFAQFAPRVPVNALHFQEWRKDTQVFDRMALIGGFGLNLTQAGEPERLAAARVSPALFPMLHARTQLGRTFLEEEDREGRDQVVVLSDGLWRRRFASDRQVIGRKILLDGRPYEVVGVLAPDFHFPKLSQLYAMTITADRPEIWKPFAARQDELELLGDHNFICVARMRPGITLERAKAELDAVQARVAARAPEKIELFTALAPLQDQITGRARTGLKLVLIAAGLVLLIGCVNIANLLLARTTSRKREIAIRAALGASVTRLMRQTLVESLLLAGMGGVLGTALAYVSIRLILSRAPVDLPRLDEVHLDLRVLLFTAAITILTGVLFGLLPALRFARVDPQEALQSGARGSTEARGAGRMRVVLVAFEVALSTVCLIAGGLLLRSFVKLLETDKGFAAGQVLTVDLNLPDSRYRDYPDKVKFMRALLESVRGIPGIGSAGVSNKLPLTGEGGNNLISLEGTTVPFTERPLADIRSASPDYFGTLGIRLEQGRLMRETDGAHPVAVVSAETAAKFWPGQNAIGKRFRVGDPDGALIEVTGVVADVRGASLDQAPALTVYLPFWQRGSYGGPSLAVRTAGDPASLSPGIRAAIRRLDAELPVPAFQTMQQIVDESVAQRRFQMSLVLLFAVAALVLASLGIYGVVSYSVAMRTNEMGIRMALGAGGGAILLFVVRQAMAPVILGLLAGVAGSLAAGRLLAGMLYGVGASDAITMSAVVVTLSGAATLASLMPAWRASRIDPLIALRYE